MGARCAQRKRESGRGGQGCSGAYGELIGRVRRLFQRLRRAVRERYGAGFALSIASAGSVLHRPETRRASAAAAFAEWQRLGSMRDWFARSSGFARCSVGPVEHSLREIPIHAAHETILQGKLYT